MSEPSFGALFLKKVRRSLFFAGYNGIIGRYQRSILWDHNITILHRQSQKHSLSQSLHSIVLKRPTDSNFVTARTSAPDKRLLVQGPASKGDL
ncbi:uncharacterized protein ARMOST_22021 [Armillaria ostoyae]|uniref:Uncharacterized protein n=1 Tax=Armillaria ostoyae TaxID=47428 RepID=A0A284SBP5_ARMOS|nr:uncharacterized protein ARMOST_22021 [Armillaria ostoyae]